MSFIAKINIDDGADARLLRALHEIFGSDQFDEFHVSVNALRYRSLLDALQFMGPKVYLRRRCLSGDTLAKVEDWLERIEGRPAGGLVLVKDRVGWSHIHPVIDIAEPRGRA
jgi:hypothetical protein